MVKLKNNNIELEKNKNQQIENIKINGISADQTAI